ncbi:MAG: META domain-containing protein [Odoribacter sp.]
MKNVNLIMIALLVMFSGCKSMDNSLILLRAHEWELKSMTENNMVLTNPRQLPTLEFSDSTAVYGSAGCNRFFATYTVGEKGMITIKPGGSTMMFCPDMQFEDAYLKALNEVKNYTIKDNELQLKDDAGKLMIVYGVVDTLKKVGVAGGDHGCNASAGYTWSEVRQNCIRIFEEGIKFIAVGGQDTTLAAYVVFAADSLQAEAFVPDSEIHPILDRRSLPNGGFAWNQEDDDTLNVRLMDGRWIIEKRGKVIYSEAK